MNKITNKRFNREEISNEINDNMQDQVQVEDREDQDDIKLVTFHIRIRLRIVRIGLEAPLQRRKIYGFPYEMKFNYFHSSISLNLQFYKTFTF